MAYNAQEMQHKRFQFLKKLYEVTKADESIFVNPSDLGAELGINGSEIDRICDYLHSEGLIGFDILDSTCIKHKGIVEVEDALSKPDEPTSYFPPVSYIIQVEQMIGSQIQQGTNQSSQVLDYNNNDTETILKIITDLKSQLPEFKLDVQTQAEVESDITTIETQIKSPHPKSTVIKECLMSLRTVLEGIAGNVTAALLMQQITILLK